MGRGVFQDGPKVLAGVAQDEVLSTRMVFQELGDIVDLVVVGDPAALVRAVLGDILGGVDANTLFGHGGGRG